MSPELTNSPDVSPALEATLSMPYTLTTGRAAGTFLAELANRRITGSRCEDCSLVLAPAQDFCPECGGDADQLLELPQSGVVTAATTTPDATLALIRLDGTGTDMLHRVDGEEVRTGTRVVARWADEATGTILDIAGFEPGDSAAAGPNEPAELKTSTEPIPVKAYHLDLTYQHSYGPYYGRLFDELAASRRILGVRCPSCRNVLVPPREYCDNCFVRTEQWVDVSDHGVIQGFSVIHMEFVGQLREPPYVYAEIVLDGSSTRLIHSIGGIDVEEAKTRLKPGTRVRAVWNDGDVKGTLEDILYFEPLFDGDADA